MAEQAADEFRQRVKAISWCHPIDLGDGLVTRPEWHIRRRYQRRLKLLQLPEDLTGKRVLDIGAWDGFFSFECERRGGDVLSIDTFAWDHHGQGGFRLARERLNSHVKDRRLAAEDLDPADVGQFDLVLFLGVFYHLRDPVAVLDRLRKITRGTLVIETHTLIPVMHGNYPLVSFFPGDGLEKGRRFEFCAIPTEEALRQMLLSAGFTKIEVMHRPTWRWAKQLKALATNRPESGRLIVHAS